MYVAVGGGGARNQFNNIFHDIYLDDRIQNHKQLNLQCNYTTNTEKGRWLGGTLQRKRKKSGDLNRDGGWVGLCNAREKRAVP